MTYWFRTRTQASITYQLEWTPWPIHLSLQRQNWPQPELSSWLDWTIVSQWLDQQLVLTYMVLLQLINHLINRYIPSNWLSAKCKFASTEKFFQVSPLLELEAQTGGKIFFRRLRHWWNFSTSLVELFLLEIFRNAWFLLIFAHL